MSDGLIITLALTAYFALIAGVLYVAGLRIPDIMPDRPHKIPTPEKSRWISVKDRLPKNGERVLAFHYLEDLDIIIIYRWDKYWKLNGTTHWQPLPEPPESEE